MNAIKAMVFVAGALTGVRQPDAHCRTAQQPRAFDNGDVRHTFSHVHDQTRPSRRPGLTRNAERGGHRLFRLALGLQWKGLRDQRGR